MIGNFVFSSGSEKGLRERNEDNYYLGQNMAGQVLIIVADGIGGEEKGEIASAIVVENFRVMFEAKNKISNFGKFYELCLENSVKQIDTVSHKIIPGRKMGSTLNAVLIEPTGEVYAFNLGDTRTYQFLGEEQQLRLISLDQNLENTIKNQCAALAQENPDQADEINKQQEKLLRQYDEGKLKALTCCIETGLKVQGKNSNYNMIKLKKDDIIIVLSDGVYNWITSKQLIDIVNSKIIAFENCAKEIIKTAFKNESNDNLTIVMVKYV